MRGAGAGSALSSPAVHAEAAEAPEERSGLGATKANGPRAPASSQHEFHHPWPYEGTVASHVQ